MRFSVRSPILLLLVPVIASLAACDSNSLVELDRNDLAAANLHQGIHRRTVSMGSRGVLRYTVSVPYISPGSSVPFVMALHGGGLVTPYYSEGYLRTQVEPALRGLGAVIVAPDIPAPSWVDPLSVEVVRTFISHVLELEKTWPVDPERIIITGYSAGGIGTWNLTDEFPELFTAGLPIAADPVGIDSRDGDSVPMYVVHGELDELFPVAGVRAAIERAQERGAGMHLVVVENAAHSSLAAYVEPLKSAVPWLQNRVWQRGPVND